MKKLLTILLLAEALGALSSPAPADAAAVEQSCLTESITSCEVDFGGTTEKIIGIRGWCYMIRWGMCSWLD